MNVFLAFGRKPTWLSTMAGVSSGVALSTASARGRAVRAAADPLHISGFSTSRPNTMPAKGSARVAQTWEGRVRPAREFFADFEARHGISGQVHRPRGA
jgi:hypothetical protein